MGARPTSRQETVWQHDALDELGVKVFEEKLAVDARPALAAAIDRTLAAAIDRMRPGDLLPVQEVDRLGLNLPDGLVVLNDLFFRTSPSRFSSGSLQTGTPRATFILDLAAALAEDRRRGSVRIIARATGLSVGTVYNVTTERRAATGRWWELDWRHSCTADL